MIWFASDHHFGHAALLTFTKDDGSHARPGFRHIDHMNETMIANHNRVVGQTTEFTSSATSASTRQRLQPFFPGSMARSA
jgi:calcineurin-like phosphoesterase family protein